MALATNGAGGVIRRARFKFHTAPLYQQVADAITSRIATGEWAEGLPSEYDLSSEMGVSMGTMRKALNALTVRGLLTRTQGHGTFIRRLVPREDLPESVTALLDAMGGGTLTPAEAGVKASGKTYTADDFRRFAEGAAEIAGWLERRRLAALREAA
jgi:DNA-binding GntR family transcriptional regulator